jgi:salicylate hydroxylase
LLGDSAHTHGGAFAAGASLAIDDAYALYLALLVAVPTAAGASIEQLKLAFELYEKTRRPWSNKVLRIVHGMFEGNRERLRAFWEQGVEEEDTAFRERIGKRLDPSWLTGYDVMGAFERVLAASRKRGGEAKLHDCEFLRLEIIS